ncbi:unnamed protein product [Adineta steineri]|uniref:Uncharacterized protein n=1 Tax=Adineta steineri TaxID=433720 RepID=A0A814UVA9_9BILA|nr:unnamed protein product [Adineta steineri]
MDVHSTPGTNALSPYLNFDPQVLNPPQSRPRQRRRRRFPRSERNKFFRENEFIPQKQSSSHFPRNRDHHSSSDQQKNEDHKLKYLYEDYSSENVHKTWKPLPLSESRKLFEYALDKYHGKFRST